RDVNDISGKNSSVIGGVLSKLTVRETDARPRYGVASVCGRRRYMEDTVSIHPSFVRKQTEFSRARWHYFGVYDGHGCSHAPRVSARGSLSDKNEEWKKMMERSFTRMDMEAVRWEETVMNANCKWELQTPNCDAVGSTAVVSVITPEKIIVANCGDSRAVLCRNGKPVPLSTDHKPDRPDELDRIQEAGGRVIYWDQESVLGVLATSRAIGELLETVLTNDAACATVQMYLNKKGGRGGGRRREATECEERKEEKVVGSRKNGKRGEITDKACAEASVLLTNLALAKHSSDNDVAAMVNASEVKHEPAQPDRPDELDRIQEAGGRVIYWDGPRVLGVLATSRAIGDNYLKPYVSSEPEVTVTDRTEEDEFMILASDGLWDVVTNEAACATVQMYLNKKGGRGGGRRREATECEERKEEKAVGSRKNGKRGEITDKACTEASVLLTKLALAKHSCDNVSVVVIELSRRRKKHVA
ncbi:hypothetical protein F2Q69_00063696, partial [Brassica cretica]